MPSQCLCDTNKKSINALMIFAFYWHQWATHFEGMIFFLFFSMWDLFFARTRGTFRVAQSCGPGSWDHFLAMVNR